MFMSRAPTSTRYRLRGGFRPRAGACHLFCTTVRPYAEGRESPTPRRGACCREIMRRADRRVAQTTQREKHEHDHEHEHKTLMHVAPALISWAMHMRACLSSALQVARRGDNLSGAARPEPTVIASTAVAPSPQGLCVRSTPICFESASRKNCVPVKRETTRSASGP